MLLSLIIGHSRKAWSLKLLKVLFLGLWQKLLSEESPKSLKLSGFYESSSGTSTHLGVVLNKCQRRLGKYFEVRNSTLHRLNLWRESKTSERDFLFKSEAVASKFSKSEEVKTSLVYQTPSGVERTVALERGRTPQKYLKLSGTPLLAWSERITWDWKSFEMDKRSSLLAPSVTGELKRVQ